MLTDFLRLLIETISFIWPLHIVSEFENSGYYVNGHFKKIRGPGLWLKIPWFHTYYDVVKVPYPITTGRMDITLSDNKTTLSFDATVMVRVVDLNMALNLIDDFHHATTVKVAATLATRLAVIDAERLHPEKRKPLLTALKNWANEETREYGVAVEDVAFNSFVLNLRTYRLLTDASASISQ